jgi:hypothetical protein
MFIFLFRLASVQENKPPIAPNMATNACPKENDKRAVLDSIQALVPDHERRAEKVEVRIRNNCGRSVDLHSQGILSVA